MESEQGGSQQVVEVVSYSDVRAVAEDAANTALERQGVTTDGQLVEVAEGAAEAAAESVAEGVAEAVQGAVEDVGSEQAEAAAKAAAEAAAEKALSGVQGKLDEQLEQLEQRAESTQEVVAVLDSDQWAAIQESYKAMWWASMTCAVMTGILAGVMLWLVIVRGR